MLVMPCQNVIMPKPHIERGDDREGAIGCHALWIGSSWSMLQQTIQKHRLKYKKTEWTSTDSRPACSSERPVAPLVWNHMEGETDTAHATGEYFPA